MNIIIVVAHQLLLKRLYMYEFNMGKFVNYAELEEKLIFKRKTSRYISKFISIRYSEKNMFMFFLPIQLKRKQ